MAAFITYSARMCGIDSVPFSASAYKNRHFSARLENNGQ